MIKIVYYKKIFALLCILTFYLGCAVLKGQSFAYTITWTVSDRTGMTTISKDDYISYRGTLFEFKLIHRWYDTVTTLTSTRMHSFDTSGVYIIKDKKYFEFDKFTKQGLLIKKGNSYEKLLGRQYSKVKKDNIDKRENSDHIKPTDTIINNLKMYYYMVKPEKGNDSILYRFLLFKSKNFTSFYKENGIKICNSKYCIIGSNILSLKTKDVFREEPTYRRRLTKEEEKISLALLKKIR